MEREGRESVGVVHAPFDSRRFYPAEYFFFFIAGRETRDANFLGCEDLKFCLNVARIVI